MLFCAVCYVAESGGHCRHCGAALYAESSVWELAVTVPGLNRLEQEAGAAGDCCRGDHCKALLLKPTSCLVTIGRFCEACYARLSRSATSVGIIRCHRYNSHAAEGEAKTESEETETIICILSLLLRSTRTGNVTGQVYTGYSGGTGYCLRLVR